MTSMMFEHATKLFCANLILHLLYSTEHDYRVLHTYQYTITSLQEVMGNAYMNLDLALIHFLFQHTLLQQDLAAL